MAQKVECVKVGDNIFQIGDIIEIKEKDSREVNGYRTYRGRIAGFKKKGDTQPMQDYLILDMSKTYYSKLCDFKVYDLKNVVKIEQ